MKCAMFSPTDSEGRSNNSVETSKGPQGRHLAKKALDPYLPSLVIIIFKKKLMVTLRLELQVNTVLGQINVNILINFSLEKQSQTILL